MILDDFAFQVTVIHLKFIFLYFRLLESFTFLPLGNFLLQYPKLPLGTMSAWLNGQSRIRLLKYLNGENPRPGWRPLTVESETAQPRH